MDSSENPIQGATILDPTCPDMNKEIMDQTLTNISKTLEEISYEIMPPPSSSNPSYRSKSKRGRPSKNSESSADETPSDCHFDNSQQDSDNYFNLRNKLPYKKKINNDSNLFASLHKVVTDFCYHVNKKTDEFNKKCDDLN
jgi:hypothetical protein